jgi:predicted enzyme related to lactoylglutathione lyase
MKKIEIIMIPVSDQQKAKEFYLKLGFQVIIEAPAAHGQTWLQMGLPDQTTTVSLAAFHGIICETDDIGNEIDRLKKRGIETERVDHTPWGRFAWIRDVDGNEICLHQK